MAQWFTHNIYLLYWVALLILMFAQAGASVIGTNVFQKRHHNGLRLASDITVRLLLSIIGFAIAVLISPEIPAEPRNLVRLFAGSLVFITLVLYFLGLKRASSEQQEQLLKSIKHTCPPTLEAACDSRLGFRGVWGLAGANVFAFLVCLTAAILMIFSIKEQTGTSGIALTKPEGEPSVRTIPYVAEPEWHSDHLFWLIAEGEREKREGIAAEYKAAELAYTCTSRMIPFQIVISVPESYTAVSRTSFQVTNSSGRRLLRELETRVPRSNLRQLRVVVPECGDNDQVITLFRVGSQNRKASMDLNDIVKARLEW